MNNIKMKIDKTAEIASTVIIKGDCIIESDVVIHDYVIIYPNTHIKKGTEIFEHCVIGRNPKSSGSTSRDLKLDYDGTIIGEYCVFSPGSIVYSGTVIGNNTLLGDNASIREECVIGEYCIISRNVSVNYEATIGHHTKIMDGSHITGRIKIGNHVFISANVTTTNDNSMGRKEFSTDHVNGAWIDDFVTIGAAANILPNVKVGKNVIIGAGSVVTKNVAEDTVVMGIPARKVRMVEE